LTGVFYVYTLNCINVTYDQIKDAANKAKHGISLALANALEWETALIWTDNRKDYGEVRQCALVLLENRLFFVAFVDRADERRVISLRKANDREVRRYVAND
jgi:uncharacterized DUF497 family protein